MISGRHIVICSSDDWNSGLKTSKYHLAIRLARSNDVLFVNSIGLRTPNLTSRRDLGRMWAKLTAWLRPPERVGERLHVLTPLVVPIHRSAALRRPNGWLLRWSVRRAMRRLGLVNPIVLVFTPAMAAVVGGLGERQSLYYCIDELTGYRGVDQGALAAMERDLLARVDGVIACSKALADRQGERHRRTFYVPHGVDWEAFSRAVDGELEVPSDLARLPRPVIGFYGFLSEDWIDFELLNHVARAHPQWSIVLIGRTGSDLGAALREPNIHVLGLRPFEELPGYSAGFDAAIIPFALNELTVHSSPLKLLEYLSAGLPVVSVDIPEVRLHGDLVRIARDHDDFVRQLEQALADDSTELHRSRRDRMRDETWEQRLDQIGTILEQLAGHGDRQP